MKILIFGKTGMLGHTLYGDLKRHGYDVVGTLRRAGEIQGNYEIIFDALASEKSEVVSLVEKVKPDVIINCIGLIKQLKDSKDKAKSIRVNALWPHILGEIGELLSIKVIHFSTDCVFSGKTGMYTEKSLPDATDVYGVTKFLGEIEYPNSLTLRTSIIGHEISTSHSLVDWFLSQKNQCKGYSGAIYSGFPTIVVSDILQKYVFSSDLNGLYHLASPRVSKFELLKLIAKEYGKNIEIIPDDEVQIDRSLDATKFNSMTGFVPPSWETLVQSMHEHFVKYVQPERR